MAKIKHSKKGQGEMTLPPLYKVILAIILLILIFMLIIKITPLILKSIGD
ncbi:MAG: hypothetical protein QXK76_00775 [Candidatus Woesearchaeota archaeon]